METHTPLFKEYTNKEEAFEAIRQMRAEGIEEINTTDLKPTSQPPTDVGTAPPRKEFRYAASGTLIGAMLGFILSNVVFMVPAFVLDEAHSRLIGGLGVFLCTAACGANGLAMSFAYAKRTSREPQSGTSRSALGVSVEPETDEQLKRARQIMKLEAVFT